MRHGAGSRTVGCLHHHTPQISCPSEFALHRPKALWSRQWTNTQTSPETMGSERYAEPDLTVLYSSSNIKVDIIGVENIGETPLNSWAFEEEGRQTIWLRDREFITKYVPDTVRILSFGYQIRGEPRLNYLATTLLRKLQEKRGENDVCFENPY